MINITKLLYDIDTPGDSIRYGTRAGEASDDGRAPRSAAGRKPVVVWNLTRTCNLRCVHCYSSSEARRYPGELDTGQAKALIDDLADFGIPALLLSGGEPLTRYDFWEIVPYARSKGLRLTLSTNGTLIDLETAQRLKDSGFTYVGISLDGIGAVNDHFRGKEGAFEAAASGIRNCLKVGQRVGLRLTLTRHNVAQLDGIFDFIRAEGIQRACFYHLVYSGRGDGMRSDDLTHAETRQAIDRLVEKADELHRAGTMIDLLTVDNHVDGVYLLQKIQQRDPERAAQIAERLTWNGGGRYSSGVGIADIDFLGNVHADQFWMDHTFGNVKERKFSSIWTDLSDPLLAGLRDQPGRIGGKCSVCKWYPMCGAGLRVRAQRVYGTPWAPDPACYLTLEECGISTGQMSSLRDAGNWREPPAHLCTM
ncbi:MAG: radical SAM protein [Deltaproteobacteria bacterium]|nr:radical SAM protein [Deltaproteobacteria bacterium]